MIPRVLLSPTFQNMRLRDVLARQHNSTGLWGAYLANETVFQATPFNRLSIWAYIAFAFIVLAVSTVIGYMTYRCCYSARRRYYSTETRAARRMGAIRLDSAKRKSSHWIRGGQYRFEEEKGRVVAKDGKRRDVKESDGLERFFTEKTIFEMKKLGFSRKQSESQENIVQYHSSISHNSDTSISEHPFEVENQYLTCPPLAHTNERAPAYIPFHLPPPPSSPTSAYKEFLERQKQLCRGKQLSHSPVSPSPSLFSDGSPPNLFKASILSTFHKPPNNQKKSKAASITKGTGPSLSAFDSNNIYYVPPLNPFATPSTMFRWNDPKLSPVAGSIINSSPLSISDHYCLTPAKPSSVPNRIITLVTPQQDSSDGYGYRYQENNNPHPISRTHFGQDNRF